MENIKIHSQHIVEELQKTMSADTATRKAAEKFLESNEKQRNYSILLLEIIDRDDFHIDLRSSASITFKNFIKRNWALTDEGVNKIHENDRLIIKQNIVSLMLKSPDKIQKQLSDAISSIGKEDFPDKWPTLMQEMIEKFQTDDFNVIIGILHTGHSIFKRYRHEFKSEALWKEILHVLTVFCTPFTDLTGKLIEMSLVIVDIRQASRKIYQALLLICKIFYSLNIQDLPAFFEDNMATWMGYFHTLLTVDSGILSSADKEEPGIMEQLKTQVCDNLTMYAQKYDEEFSPYLPGFVTDVWHLLINTGVYAKYDLLVSNAIKFLASVAERAAYKSLFEDPGTLSSICEKVIVPNMEFRDADEEAFEDNAEEYIRRDIEGSDIDTRRRAACDLVRALSKSFEQTVIQNFSVYIQHMLQLYQQDPRQYWKSKDAAIFLVTSLAAKAQTQKHGVTQTSQLVDVVEFFNNHVVQEINTPDVNENPVIKADAIKYIMVFRAQLPKASLTACLPSLIRHLKSTSHVIHSYAACCIEKLLSMKTNQLVKADIAPYKDDLILNLFNALQMQGSEENEYIMRAIMRCLHTLENECLVHIGFIVPALFSKITAVSKNPCKPHFNHFLFETLCLCITTSCSADPKFVSQFEEALFPIFEGIMNGDVQEFIPYVFQVLSLMLEKHVDGVPAYYKGLFHMLLRSDMWDKMGNIPAQCRLIQAFISVGSSDADISSKLEQVLGVFQKLLASRTNDHLGLQLLTTLLAHTPENQMRAHYVTIFSLLFRKLTSSKTTKFARCVVAFFSVFIVKRSLPSFMEVIESIQARMFAMVVEKLFLAEAASVNIGDRKICAVALTKVVCDPMFYKDDAYVGFWLPLVKVIIQLFETAAQKDASDSQTENDEGVGLISEEFQTVHSQLMYSRKTEPDYCPEVHDAKINLARSLHALSLTNRDVGLRLSQLEPEVQLYLQQYMSGAGVAIA